MVYGGLFDDIRTCMRWCDCRKGKLTDKLLHDELSSCVSPIKYEKDARTSLENEGAVQSTMPRTCSDPGVSSNWANTGRSAENLPPYDPNFAQQNEFTPQNQVTPPPPGPPLMPPPPPQDIRW